MYHPFAARVTALDRLLKRRGDLNAYIDEVKSGALNSTCTPKAKI